MQHTHRQAGLLPVRRYGQGAQICGGELGPVLVLGQLVQHLDLRVGVVSVRGITLQHSPVADKWLPSPSPCTWTTK